MVWLLLLEHMTRSKYSQNTILIYLIFLSIVNIPSDRNTNLCYTGENDQVVIKTYVCLENKFSVFQRFNVHSAVAITDKFELPMADK